MNSLGAVEPAGVHPQVKVPAIADMRDRVRHVISNAESERRYFCVADLEEAVNQTYSRAVRRAFPQDTLPEELASVTVNLEGDDLIIALDEVRKSIDGRSIGQFIKDATRYCGKEIAQSLRTRFNV